jgi:hypothetical protein
MWMSGNGIFWLAEDVSASFSCPRLAEDVSDSFSCPRLTEDVFASFSCPRFLPVNVKYIIL